MSLFTAQTKAEVEDLVSQGHDVNGYANFRTPLLRTPLQKACQSGNLHVVKALCELGAIPTLNKYGIENDFPIALAALRGHTNVVKYLAPIINALGVSLGPAMIGAISSESTDIVNFLLDELLITDLEEKVYFDSFLSYQSFLEKACMVKNITIVEKLLAHGANPNHVNETTGTSAIFNAMWCGNYLKKEMEALHIVKLLVAYSVNIYQKTDGDSLLMIAVNSSSIEIVDFLLGCGLNPNEVGSRGCSVLQNVSVTAPDDTKSKLYNLLLDACADPHLNDYSIYNISSVLADVLEKRKAK
jgi:ankyrin repeat protein